MKYKLRDSKLTHSVQGSINKILENRGIIDVKSYLNPTEANENDPVLLDNIDDAVKLLSSHLKNKTKILFVVDADTDGYCSSSMLWNYIKDIYPDSNLHYIFHNGKKHGLSDLLDDVISLEPNLVILPDASSTDYDQHKFLYENSIDVLVIDHHEADKYSDYAVVVNNQLSSKYPNKTLCGAGVVYKFLQRFDKLNNFNNANKFLDLCALGLIADCMSPKDLETRYYISKGLSNIVNKGFQGLIDAQSYSLFNGYSKELNYNKIAFYIAPLINAIVRVGNAREREELFLNFIDPERKVPCEKYGKIGPMVPLYEELSRKAVNAKARQNRIKDKAIDLLDMRIMKEDLLENKILIVEVYDEDNIPQELTGLLAGVLVEKYKRPCAIVRKSESGLLRGSIRNNENFEEVPNFRSFLLNSGLMEYVEGHANAAGLSFPAKSLNRLLNYANNNISDEGLENVYLVDYVFDEDEKVIGDIILNMINYEDLWGNDMKEPTAIVKDIIIPSSILFAMGKNQDSSKFLHNGVEYICFKNQNFINQIKQDNFAKVTVYGTFSLNNWKGQTIPQFLINDYEITSLKYVF